MPKVGAAFTGQPDPDEEDTPLRNIVTSATQSPAYQSVLGDPASRSALLQIGLGLMQPNEIGQSTFGHIGQAIGSGGETVGRIEEGDIKQQAADTKLAQAQNLYEVAKQNADTKARKAQEGTLGGLTAALLYRMQRDQTKDEQDRTEATKKELDAESKRIDEKVNEIAADKLLPAGDEELTKYRGMTRPQIRKALEAQRAPTATSVPPQQPAATAKPPTIKQGGFVYKLQPDGSYQ